MTGMPDELWAHHYYDGNKLVIVAHEEVPPNNNAGVETRYIRADWKVVFRWIMRRYKLEETKGT
jgi:hypothetical protein